MKYFKLVKTYPGSPKLGTLYSEQPTASFEKQAYGECGKIAGEPLFDLQDYPEFWKLMSMPTKYKVHLVRHDSGLRESPQKHNYHKLLNECTVFTVERKSDGMVFSVGDLINTGEHPKTITALIPDDIFIGGVRVETSDGGSVGIGYEFLEKGDNPLFITYDGVKLYNQTQYSEIYGVALQASGSDVLRKGYSIGIGEYAKPYKNRDWFFDKEAAEHYILMNKPCLSGQDVVKYIEDNVAPVKAIHPNFIDLLKSKQ